MVSRSLIFAHELVLRSSRRAFGRTIFMLAACMIERASIKTLQADDTPAAPAAPAGPKYTLVYKFHPGDVVRTNVLQHVVLETTIQGTTQTAETTSASVKVWKIKDIDAD